MSLGVSLEAHEWDVFGLPQSVRLVGENQHLLGAGCVVLATSMRLGVEVGEAEGPFALRVVEGPTGRETERRFARVSLSEYQSVWEDALQDLLLGDGPSLEGLEVLLDFGPLWGICPPEVLLTSPAAAVALTVAAAAHRGELDAMSEQDLAAAACRVRDAVVPGGAQDRHYAEVLLSVQGGAGYAEPGTPPVNVQQLVPPDAMLLALVPQMKASRGKQPFDEPVRTALAQTHRQGAGIMQAGDEGLSALFAMDGLAQEQTTMLYGLLRVRHILDAFLEYLGDPYVDNDRLAEVCDEESAILADYFGFPAEAYAAVRTAAGEAGALGAKLTWAFGGLPAAILIAPGRRQAVQKALRRAVPQAHVLPLDLDTTGLSAVEAL